MFKYISLAVVAMVGSSQAVSIEQKAQMKAQIDTAIDSYLDADVDSGAEWGFLKNIVNIDRFFDSGVKAWASVGPWPRTLWEQMNYNLLGLNT